MVAATLILLCTQPLEVSVFGHVPWLLTLPSIAIIGREVINFLAYLVFCLITRISAPTPCIIIMMIQAHSCPRFFFFFFLMFSRGWGGAMSVGMLSLVATYSLVWRISAILSNIKEKLDFSFPTTFYNIFN